MALIPMATYICHYSFTFLDVALYCSGDASCCVLYFPLCVDRKGSASGSITSTIELFTFTIGEVFIVTSQLVWRQTCQTLAELYAKNIQRFYNEWQNLVLHFHEFFLKLFYFVKRTRLFCWFLLQIHFWIYCKFYFAELFNIEYADNFFAKLGKIRICSCFLWSNCSPTVYSVFWRSFLKLIQQAI